MESAQTYAKKIVKSLTDKGYIAYFAGGWVRDYLMDHPSSDIDIATDAPPEMILKIFPKTIQVGLTFGVVIVSIDKHLFEVATFRRDINYEDGRKPEKIELSTPREDAYRRDFTINGMFYDPINEEILDFVNGKKDIEKKIIRTIGNPHERFVEDRLRMIRAIRFASRFQFSINLDTRQAIKENAETLFPAVTMERIWQELTKMSEYPRFDVAIMEMHRLGLLSVIFPSLKEIHLNTVKQWVAPFSLFPKKASTVLFLLELFPNANVIELTELCQYLKTSNRDIKLIIFAYHAKLMMEKLKNDPKGIGIVDWVHFYADPRSELCLQTEAAHFPDAKERHAFLKFHTEKQKKLETHIDRIRRNKPLVTAAMLQSQGIKPGIVLGNLLREAERRSIRQDIHDPDTIIQQLKETELWQY